MADDYGFRIVDGRICDPGKFQYEPEWAPYFYDNANDGEILSVQEDGCGDFASLIAVTPPCVKLYPDLEGVAYVLIVEDSQGFVYASTVEDEAEANDIRQQYADIAAEYERLAKAQAAQECGLDMADCDDGPRPPVEGETLCLDRKDES